MNESDAQLKTNYMELKEWEAVLEKTDEFFQGVGFAENSSLGKGQ